MSDIHDRKNVTGSEGLNEFFALTDEQLAIAAALSTDDATNAALRSLDDEKAEALALSRKPNRRE